VRFPAVRADFPEKIAPQMQKPLNSFEFSGFLYLVAGTGFEPVTFGL
jgi:hypothetical protein